MPVNSFITRIFKKEKELLNGSGKPGTNSSQEHQHKTQHHHQQQQQQKQQMNSNKSSNNASISSQIHSVKLDSSSSSISTIHPVDSHSHLPHLKLARFLEKRHLKHTEEHFLQNLEGHAHDKSFSNNNNNNDDSNSSSSNNNKTRVFHNGTSKLNNKKTSSQPKFESKFNNYDALVQLVSKYGIIPDNSVDLMKLLNMSDDDKIPILESKNVSTALVIGQGAGGSVYPLYDDNKNHLYAMKKLRLKSSGESWSSYESKLKNEFKIASKLHHQNLIRTYDLLQDNDLFVIVMDYAPFDFFTVVMAGELTKHEVYCYFKQMCIGVSYMHSIGLAHRDLKLDNCVVDHNGILKLVDFGSSVIFDPKRYEGNGQRINIEKATGIMGSDPYLAPEVVTVSYYDPSLADVWSLAIIYCCMVLHRFPWRLPKTSDSSYAYFISEPGEITDEKGNKKVVGPDRLLRLLPTSSKDLIDNMLKVNPDERFSMEQVSNNEFFKRIHNCHYDNFDSETNRGTIVKGDHTHHLITNRQYTDEHPDEVKKEKEREAEVAKKILSENGIVS